MDAVDGDVEENVTQAVADDPANEFAVNVTPLESVNVPPAVAPPRVSLRSWPELPRLVSTLIAIGQAFATSTSPEANVTAATVPLGVVAQTSAALILPDLRA